MRGVLQMIWMLYKRSARAVGKATVAALLDRSIERVQQRVLIRQISRIVCCVRQAHSQHPAWLQQQYGTIDVYLEKHLSADDWRFLVELRNAELANELAVQSCPANALSV